jgi:hypothetical protein
MSQRKFWQTSTDFVSCRVAAAGFFLGRVSDPDLDPDPYSIGPVDPDPDPYSESGSESGSRRAKMTHKRRKNSCCVGWPLL